MSAQNFVPKNEFDPPLPRNILRDACEIILYRVVLIEPLPDGERLSSLVCGQ